MCTNKEKNIIHNVNRTVIGIIGAASTLIDGFHAGDVMCLMSMTIWLMQPECNAVEEKVFDRCKAQLAALRD